MKTNTYRRYKKPNLPINGKQVTIIKMAQGHLVIADDDYRDMLETRYGVRSCTKLTYDQASEFIRELEGKGFTLKPRDKARGARNETKSKPRIANHEPRPSIPRTGNVIALVKPDEIDKINAIAALIPWHSENGLALFLEKRMGITGGKVRTSQQAYLAIEGLKKMFANGMKKAYGEAWWTRVYSDPAINEFIRRHKPAEWR